MARSKTELQVATLDGLPPLPSVGKLSRDEQFDAVNKGRQLCVLGAAYTGHALEAIKHSCKHGEFQAELAKHGWSRQWAHNYMKFAELAKRVEATNPAALPHLDMHHWLALKDLPEDQFNRFIKGETVLGLTIDEASEKSVRELREIIREQQLSADNTITKLQKQNTDLTVELDTQRHRNKALQERIGKPFKNSDVPQYLAVQRHESHNLAETVLLCLDELDGMVTELEESPAALSSGNKHLTIAVNSLYTHVNALYARAQGIVERLHQGAHSELIEHTLLPDIVYTEEEALAVLEDRALMVGEHNQEKAHREIARENAKPRGRGRPKKAGK